MRSAGGDADITKVFAYNKWGREGACPTATINCFFDAKSQDPCHRWKNG